VLSPKVLFSFCPQVNVTSTRKVSELISAHTLGRRTKKEIKKREEEKRGSRQEKVSADDKENAPKNTTCKLSNTNIDNYLNLL
jgi:hypothetical protein